MSEHKPLQPRFNLGSHYGTEVTPKKVWLSGDKRKLGFIAGAVAVLAALLFFAATNLFGSSGVDNSANALLGGESLSQGELINLVKANDLNAYWAGPQEGAEYSLTVTSDNQVFVKYLPGGLGLEDSNPTYRIIATYPEPAAFDTTLAAGSQPNSLVFVNSDGAAVYLDKTRANNVYVAYPDVPYSVEVFDPDANTALSIASLPGNVKKIE